MVKMTLGVEGMMCPHCEAHVNEDISKAFKVESVVSDHDANTTVVVAEAAISEDELKKVCALELRNDSWKIIESDIKEIESSFSADV